MGSPAIAHGNVASSPITYVDLTTEEAEDRRLRSAKKKSQKTETPPDFFKPTTEADFDRTQALIYQVDPLVMQRHYAQMAHAMPASAKEYPAYLYDTLPQDGRTFSDDFATDLIAAGVFLHGGYDERAAAGGNHAAGLPEAWDSADAVSQKEAAINRLKDWVVVKREDSDGTVHYYRLNPKAHIVPRGDQALGSSTLFFFRNEEEKKAYLLMLYQNLYPSRTSKVTAEDPVIDEDTLEKLTYGLELYAMLLGDLKRVTGAAGPFDNVEWIGPDALEMHDLGGSRALTDSQFFTVATVKADDNDFEMSNEIYVPRTRAQAHHKKQQPMEQQVLVQEDPIDPKSEAQYNYGSTFYLGDGGHPSGTNLTEKEIHERIVNTEN